VWLKSSRIKTAADRKTLNLDLPDPFPFSHGGAACTDCTALHAWPGAIAR
jgi:hypothetical protein